jgi:pyrroloquinoline quinone biosynthesis protein E
MDGSSMPETTIKGPLWLLAELTYVCPLQCPYCSNPLELTTRNAELDTASWKRVLGEARELGALQLGLSGGEPLLRPDLDQIAAHARQLGYYSNLITSGVGMDAARVHALKQAGVDHIQLSFQSPEQQLNDYIAGTKAYAHKLDMARAVKANGFPMVLCFVVYRDNIGQIGQMLELAQELEADYVELATVQYYGWAHLNRQRLLPTLHQVREAEREAKAWQERPGSRMKVYFVVPDYYENRPKPCMNGWGSVFLTVTPDGRALPCHAAGQLPGLDFPNVRDVSVEQAWFHSEGFNRYRGHGWMKEPCRSCDEKDQDFGGCRCQAFQFTGDPANADPVCAKSPQRPLVDEVLRRAAAAPNESPLVFRNPRTARKLAQVCEGACRD